MPDILLIQPPIRDFYLTKKRTIPYGLASIAAKLIREGFSVEILDCLATNKAKSIPLPDEMGYLKAYYPRPDRSPFSLFHQFRHYGYSYEYIGKQVSASKAFLVGISSLFTPYSREALQIASLVKQHLPAAKVVLGGHHPTAFPEQVLNRDGVDFVIRGEGEQSMALLAKALQSALSWEQIPGLCYQVPAGKPVIKTPTLVEDPTEFPLPAIHLIKTSFYQRNRKGSMVIMTARGCSMKCSYCSVSAASYLTYRKRPLAAVLQEIDAAVESGVRFLDFEDENLSFQRGWFLQLLEMISKRYAGLNLELRAMNGLLPTTLDETVIRAMAEAGFKELNLSLCTLSKAQLKRFSRPDVRFGFERALTLAEKFGLSAVGYVIIGAPWQHPTESLQDLVYLAEKRVLAGVSVYYPSPGSADFDSYQHQNLFPEEALLTRSTALPVSQVTSRLETVTLLRLGRLINFMKSVRLDLINNDNSTSEQCLEVKLVEQFLRDGNIRGIAPTGEIFEHNISHSLTQSFLSKFNTAKLMAAC